MSIQNTATTMKGLGIKTICGSVIEVSPLKDGETWWDRVRTCNDSALKLKEIYDDFYIPGFHIHPDYPQDSIIEINKMYDNGIRLIGELVPYLMGYMNYHTPGLDKIVEYATEKGMIFSLHTMPDDNDLDAFVSAHPKATIVAAHPGERNQLMRHIERMKHYPNYYIDLSGEGTFRHGMIKRVIDEVGANRILFGSDFPTCSPAMFLGSVLLDDLITPKEKQAILADNAKRLLQL